ncbi:glucose-6-phosphate isomerase [Amorphoplanes nipponensis]|uniref:Glucose-6-phosphate isomerase n=1 Tax=Actinoplanes nipponensis TaxID=135950 RepID=A0A919MR85_9ACTN|nr:glucose-6-phosphate isomerase [Actinoplanes nipponensis]GIE46670.1 glucose-6-phosphate isomerase [Actinoplanes nipponensis]
MTDDLLADVEAAAGFAVHGGPGPAARRGLVARGVPGLLAGQDPTLWGPAAEERARERLGFLDAYRPGAELLPLIAELREELGDLHRVVLAGPGRAAEAATRLLDRPLTVLDDPDPHRVRALLDDAALLRRTVVLLIDETLGSVFWQAYRDAGLTAAEAGRHFVVLGNAPPELAAAGAVTIGAGPGALSAATLVPAAFAGVDVAALIDEAELFAPSLADEQDNPALALGAALAAARRVLLVPDGPGLDGLGEWAAEVITAGLGLPVIVADCPRDAGPVPADLLTVSYGGCLPPAGVPGGGMGPAVAVNGPLGAHFLAWPYAVALAAHVRGADPFRDLPPAATEAVHDTPSFVEGPVEIFTTGTATDLRGALRELLATAEGQIRVQAFLDPAGDAAVARLRPLLAAATGLPVGFGWGGLRPGEPPYGSFLQITGAVTGDVPVPGRDSTLGDRQAARAAGDRRLLAGHGRPLLRLHLTDRPEGIGHLLAAAGTSRH